VLFAESRPERQGLLPRKARSLHINLRLDPKHRSDLVQDLACVLWRLAAYERLYGYLPRHAALVVSLSIESVSPGGFLAKTNFDFIAYLPTGATSPGGGASFKLDLGYRGGWLDATLGTTTAFAIIPSTSLPNFDVFAAGFFVEPALKFYTSSQAFTGEHLALEIRTRIIPALEPNDEDVLVAFFLGLSLLWD